MRLKWPINGIKWPIRPGLASSCLLIVKYLDNNRVTGIE